MAALEARNQATTVEFDVAGMHCESCASLIEEVTGELAGVSASKVDLESGSAVVTFDAAEVSVEELFALISDIGYTPTARATA